MAVIALIDYGMGNLHSAAKALERVAPAGTRVRLCAHPEDLAGVDRVVFPGVGAIRDCMDALRRQGLDEALREVAMRLPLLGICVGMQALMEHSEENEGVECLGILPGRVRRFPEPLEEDGRRLKVPHMGWNQVHQVRSHPLWSDIPQDSRFYFVHSYYVDPADPDPVIGRTRYGIEFASALARANVAAVQFHPEKSQRWGLALLANFVTWKGQ